MGMDKGAEPEEEREIVTRRVINGPRRLVFRAWTEAHHLARWLGPHGFTITTAHFEFRPGGVWEFEMHGPDGTDYPNWVEWQEIVPGERIVYRQGTHWADPDTFESTVTFADLGERTEITLRTLFNTRAQRDYLNEHYHVVEGARQTLERLEEYVAELGAPIAGGGAS